MKIMNYTHMFEDSFEYVKDALWGKWVRWLLLIVCAIIFPLFFGYIMEIMRGKKPAPELENWSKLFIDGLKLLVVGIVYMIPVLIVATVFVGAMMFTMSPAMMFGGMLLAGLLTLIAAFIILIFASIAFIRFSRLDNFSEAFNFNAILEHIRRIGWGNYLVGLLLVYVALLVIRFIIEFVPFIGGFLNFVLIPAYGIFFARFITLLYDFGEVHPAQTGA